MSHSEFTETCKAQLLRIILKFLKTTTSSILQLQDNLNSTNQGTVNRQLRRMKEDGKQGEGC